MRKVSAASFEGDYRINSEFVMMGCGGNIVEKESRFFCAVCARIAKSDGGGSVK